MCVCVCVCMCVCVCVCVSCVPMCSQEGQTALHVQAAKGNVSVVKFLIEQFNPDLDAFSQVGEVCSTCNYM